MRQIRKPKLKREVPELCAAVRRIRQTTGWSQDEMSRQTGIATQTLSRFELGKQVPRDLNILVRLREAAGDAGLRTDEKLFNDAINERYGPGDYSPGSKPSYPLRSYTPQQWRLMQAARIAAQFFPAQFLAMEKAAGPALHLVDEVIAAAAPDRDIDEFFLGELEDEVSALAARRVFQSLRKEGQ